MIESVVYLAVALLLIAIFVVDHFFRWLQWRKLPSPTGVDDVVINVRGQRRRVVADKRSQIDYRVVGYVLVDDWGDRVTVGVDFYGWRLDK